MVFPCIKEFVYPNNNGNLDCSTSKVIKWQLRLLFEVNV